MLQRLRNNQVHTPYEWHKMTLKQQYIGRNFQKIFMKQPRSKRKFVL